MQKVSSSRLIPARVPKDEGAILSGYPPTRRRGSTDISLLTETLTSSLSAFYNYDKGGHEAMLQVLLYLVEQAAPAGGVPFFLVPKTQTKYKRNPQTNNKIDVKKFILLMFIPCSQYAAISLPRLRLNHGPNAEDNVNTKNRIYRRSLTRWCWVFQPRKTGHHTTKN